MLSWVVFVAHPYTFDELYLMFDLVVYLTAKAESDSNSPICKDKGKLSQKQKRSFKTCTEVKKRKVLAPVRAPEAQI